MMWCDVFMWRVLVEQTSQSALCAPSCLTSHVAMRFIDTQLSTTSSWTSMTRSVRISSTTTWSRSWVEPLGTAVHQRVVGNVVFTTRCYASALLAMSLCLSVSVSVFVTSRSSTKMTKRRITQTTPHDTPRSLVFCCQRSPRNSTGVTPYEGAECRWGGQNRRLSTNNRLYLKNGTR